MVATEGPTCACAYAHRCSLTHGSQEDPACAPPLQPHRRVFVLVSLLSSFC